MSLGGRLESFADVLAMKENEVVQDLADSYGRRTGADGRAILRLCNLQNLIGLIHWVQDYQRVGEKPTIVGINDAAQFCAALSVRSRKTNLIPSARQLTLASRRTNARGRNRNRHSFCPPFPG